MFDFSSITNSWAYILEGVKYTIELTIITAVGGLILGTGLALCRLSTSKILSEFSKLYTNLMRAVPLVLVLEPVLRGRREASFGKGGLALAVSFAVLLASFLVVYVLFGYDAVAFAAGLVAGFVVVWLAVAIRVIMLP